MKHFSEIRILATILSLTVLSTVIFSSCGKSTYKATAGEPITDGIFSTDSSDETVVNAIEALNAIYNNFGDIGGETGLVQQYGNEATYFEWIAEKAMWTGDEEYISGLKFRMINYPQTDNGYLWSWGDSTYWPTGDGDMHYDGLFRFVAATAKILSWEQSTGFLSETDTNTVGENTALDASCGRTIYEKCRLAIDYAIKLLHGDEGAIRITEESVFLADGTTRFDLNADGKQVWNNTGCLGSSPSNYWDNLCFGNIDAYETALFYHALLSMADIETALGNTENAENYKTLSEKVKGEFDSLFWNEETGRYIACIDTEGNRWDFGLTFLNTEILSYGLGDEKKAEMIFSWIDGERIVEGDTVTGTAIMDYSAFLKDAFGKKVFDKELPFVPRTNTVAIESVCENGDYWWYSLNGGITLGDGGNANFATHLENGGYIFYTLFCELTARAKYQGTDEVMERLSEIDAVYSVNGFNSDILGWAEGLIGEFPENGQVYSVFINEILGIKATPQGVLFAPSVPDTAGTVSVGKVVLGGESYSVSASSDTLLIESDNPISLSFSVEEKTGKIREFTFTTASGEEISKSVTADTGTAFIDNTVYPENTVAIRLTYK